MSTISLSVSDTQLLQLDELMNRFGFENRSEFFRAVLRFVTTRPDVLHQSAIFPFQPTSPATVNQVMTDFKATNKYTPEFLAELEIGLKESNYFDN